MFEKRLSLPVVVLSLLVILFVACFLRFYRLGVTPPGLYVDEAFFGDLAYCVLSTGRDFEGVSWPLVSHGHFTTILPLQFYPMVVSVFVFGFDVFAVRFVPAFLGVLIVLVTFLLARFLFNDFVALLSAFLVVVSPWHVVYSRIGFGNIMPMAFFFLLGLYFFLKGIYGNGKLMVLGAFCFGLTFFSYHLAHLFVSLFLFGLHFLFYNRASLNNGHRFYYLSVFVIVLFFASSLIASSTGKILMPVMASSIKILFDNLLGIVSSVFSFTEVWELPYLNFNPIYPLYLPLIVFGLFLLLWDRNSKSILFVFWISLAFVIGAFSSDIPGGAIRRAFTCAGPVLEIITAYAIYWMLFHYKTKRNVFCLLAVLISFSLFFSASNFAFHYFSHRPSISDEKFFMTPLQELFNYTESAKSQYKSVVFSSELASRRCAKYDSTLQQDVYYICSLGFEDYLRFYTKSCTIDAKYTFGDVDSYLQGDSVIYVTKDQGIPNIPSTKVFNYSNGEPAYWVYA